MNLVTLCKKGLFDEVKKRLEEGEDPNQTNTVSHPSRHDPFYSDLSPLSYFVNVGIHIPTPALTLMAQSLEICLCEQVGDTGLHAASGKGRADIVNLLLDNNADVNVKNKVCLGVGGLRSMKTIFVCLC